LRPACQDVITVPKKFCVRLMIEAAQIRAARGLVEFSQTQLAEASGLALSTIRRMEVAGGTLKRSVENVQKVQQALEDAGVIFIDEDDEGPGVRLRKQRD
jgi:predicted transcriptional regulator